MAHYSNTIIPKCMRLGLLLFLAACPRNPDPTATPHESKSTQLPPSATPVSPLPVNTSTAAPVNTTASAGPYPGSPSSFQPLAQRASPAVVTIITEHARMRRSYFGAVPERQKGLGSGFLIDKAGTILTNNHVIAGSTTIQVALSNGKRLEGKVVGVDPPTDVAVVKIEPPEGIVPIPLGDSDTIAVGDWVVAIGNPLGLSHTVTAGILSAKGRSHKEVPINPVGGEYAHFDFLQTDAAINPGNSGGPLLNLKGEVIGINTAINAAGQGLAFAIPIKMVKLMLPSLVKNGRLVRSYIGIGGRDEVDDSTTLEEKGVSIAIVYRNTPAEKAGLKKGDRILAIDGTLIKDFSHLRWLISVVGPNHKATLRVTREGKTFDLPVTLEEAPKTNETPRQPDDDDSITIPLPP